MIKPLHIMTVAFCLFVHFNSEAKDKGCKKYEDKYRAIQAKQRQSNKIKRSNQLKEQELKAFNQWWQCKQGKIK